MGKSSAGEHKQIKSYKKQTADDNDLLIRKYMKERLFPNWYRGLSYFQLNAADSLITSIRDDSEQGTTHRVRDDLIKLGLMPVVAGHAITLVMRLSRGNDLAFLWFLMELYYRRGSTVSNKKTFYTVNEQIIISAIAHLDTITTLRELDRILPKYKPKPVEKKPVPKKTVKKRKTTTIGNVMPYFQKQVRPKTGGKPLVIRALPSIPMLDRYELTTTTIIGNECNRWFADYKLSTDRLATKKALEDQIKLGGKQVEPGHVHEINPIFCAEYKKIRLLKERLLDELEKTKEKLYNKYYGSDKYFKTNSFKYVIKMLENYIEQAKDEFEGLEEDIRINLKPTASATATNRSKQGSTITLSSNQADSASSKSSKSQASDPASKLIKASSKDFRISDLSPKDKVKRVLRRVLADSKKNKVSIAESQAVEKTNKVMENKEVKNYKILSARKKNKKRKVSPHRNYPVLNFGNVEYIDPRNEEFMEHMLKTAINELKKDKKFVLPSLPEAHNTPILRMWIRKRYGMAFEKEEKQKAADISKTVFNEVRQRHLLNARLPVLDDLATRPMISYGCWKYLFRKGKYIRDRYFHDFKEQFLKNSRTYWGIARPYHCSNGPPIREFFSYLPSRENDIHMFRPWRPTEIMPAKVEWDRRRRKETYGI